MYWKRKIIIINSSSFLQGEKKKKQKTQKTTDTNIFQFSPATHIKEKKEITFLKLFFL